MINRIGELFLSTIAVKSLNSILEPGGSALFPYDSIWRAYVPPKVAFFAWEAS